MPPYVSPGQRPVQVRRSAYETLAIIHVEEIARGRGSRSARSPDTSTTPVPRRPRHLFGGLRYGAEAAA
ncbi:hypothetical protein SAMN05446589_0260 [Streptomyces sp. OV198]|nr:hypothetical protein SAMN05446589_0260 [Streptomyces sp. OV198]